MKPICRILVANRSEIAIRAMRAASELGIQTVGIYAMEDRFALHRLKADASYQVGAGKTPIQAYLDIQDILRIAQESGADAIYPGYGFLSENPDFAQACADAGIEFIGPTPQVMRMLGNKVAARKAAIAAGVPVIPASEAIPRDVEAAKAIARDLGYPLMLKASWGGGGRGMRTIDSEADLPGAIAGARREALTAFGNDEVYLERRIMRAHHVEVQVLGDRHGNLVHLFERDCSIQRRHQKVVERAPAPYLSNDQRQQLCDAALRLCKSVGYTHAGTVEFLLDGDSGEFFFIEVNPRIQVEHTVTEMVTGIDLVKAQIHISEGARIGAPGSGIAQQSDIHLHGHALQCRITTENPERDFAPDYGKLTAYRSPGGGGIRLDAGTAYTGAVITPYYDSLLVKVTAWGNDTLEATLRMKRALREFRIRGLSNNLKFLVNVISHPAFLKGECTTHFIDETPSLLTNTGTHNHPDRATRLLDFMGEVIVNGNPEMKGRTPVPYEASELHLPFSTREAPPPGSRDRLHALGPRKFAQWMRAQKGVLLTDTSMRDAHQSLFATRMRTADMLPIAPHYARQLSNLFSLECWGGATFDVAMRFLKEDPWQRLIQLRQAIPNVLLQMLLRGSNAVGYTNYPDNVVCFFVQQAAKAGIDLFRVFDSLNNIENMRVSMDAVLETGALCEAALCYTSDIFDTSRPKYSLKYYLDLARQFEKAGAHIIGIKDMSGVCRPRAAATLVKALREEVGLPLHFHTHDTSGASTASVLAAIGAGVDAVDGTMDALSGLTSQPPLGAIIAALEGDERAPAITLSQIQPFSHYWEGVRHYYTPFESEMRAGTSDVYRHEMPGGQYTNLREQARAMGLAHRWDDIARTYAEVNMLFGDIVKVTPTSKVVGDMALYMVVNDLCTADIFNPSREIAFPESVVALMRGDLGLPPDGFPPELQRKVLKGEAPLTQRPGAVMPPTDLDAERKEVEAIAGRPIDDHDLASYLMYPKVFTEFAQHHKRYGDVSILPTQVFFSGLPEDEEIAVLMEHGKMLSIQLQGRNDAEDGKTSLFFELNGEPRQLVIRRAGTRKAESHRPKVAEGNPYQVGAPMPGAVSALSVKVGQKVEKGAPLLSIEAMKMETVLVAERSATIAHIWVKPGDQVDGKDLLIDFVADA